MLGVGGCNYDASTSVQFTRNAEQFNILPGYNLLYFHLLTYIPEYLFFLEITDPVLGLGSFTHRMLHLHNYRYENTDCMIYRSFTKKLIPIYCAGCESV
jgi:hypothetical protein